MSPKTISAFCKKSANFLSSALQFVLRTSFGGWKEGVDVPNNADEVLVHLNLVVPGAVQFLQSVYSFDDGNDFVCRPRKVPQFQTKTSLSSWERSIPSCYPPLLLAFLRRRPSFGVRTAHYLAKRVVMRPSDPDRRV
ncbi:hypothetical protein QR680_008956 [Steinernema hermaphroditum]|uniref:Uncharacterized protein n=1 Tax=Steinernema hermaphroditum TaxID=289476 RepID=A0AA39IIL1_9BILA|nr:hypothetical protein QR680_008956 [Steinernema hermaphroditum]